MADFIISTTAHFDAGTKRNTATETDLANVNADELYIGVQAEAVKTSLETTQTVGAVGKVGGVEYWHAQSFQVSSDTFITALSVWIRSVVGTPPDVILDLKNDNGGEPDSLIMSTEQKAYGDLNLNDWTKFAFSGLPYKISSGITYWIVMRPVSTPDNNNYYNWEYIGGNNYPDGNRVFSTNQGSTWTQRALDDMIFRVHSKDHMETVTDLNPLLDTERWGSVMKDGSIYHLYYSYDVSGDDQIGHATSSNGRDWTLDTANNPVLSVVDGCWVPWVWKEGATWYMVYTKYSGGLQAVCVANSPDGVNWTEQAILIIPTPGTWDLGGCENWGVIKDGSTYRIWYNAGGGITRRTGSATTTDAPADWDSNSFTKDANNPIYDGGRFCVSQFKRGSFYYMLVPHYTSGSDYSEIELYRDTASTFYSGSRTFVGLAQPVPGSGWNSEDQDTPMVVTDDINCNSFNATNGELWCYFSGFLFAWKQGALREFNFDEALTLINGAWNPITYESSWESAEQTVAANKKLGNTTISASGLSSTYYLKEVQWLVNGVIKAAYRTDIISGTSILLEENDLTYGTFDDVNTDFTIKLFFGGDGNGTLTITQLEGDYIDITRNTISGTARVKQENIKGIISGQSRIIGGVKTTISGNARVVGLTIIVDGKIHMEAI